MRGRRAGAGRTRGHPMTEDRHRPEYHFVPPANWMNDPNGLIQWGGLYHLFYQYNPYGAFSATKHWGHAVSKDLVHWEHWPVALAPTPGGPDKDGCYSGCAVDDAGAPTLVYTGISPEVQCIATSDDGMRTWRKWPDNPVIGGPPEGLTVTGFRDPCVWREGNLWRMVVGSGLKGVGGTALLYQSTDLCRWEYLRPLCTGDAERTGHMWECPDLFPLAHKHILVISPQPLRRSLYLVGIYAEDRFVPEKQAVVDVGGHFYAPQTLLDDHGRRIMWGWIWEGRSRNAQANAGWAGVMSLPRVMSLHRNGVIGWDIAPELQSLRAGGSVLENVRVPSQGDVSISCVKGDALELIVQFRPAGVGDRGAFGLVVRRSPDGEEQTVIRYDVGHQRLSIDRYRSSRDEETVRDVQGGRLTLCEDEGLALHVFLDHSVLEVVANGRLCLTSRIYPTREDSIGVSLVAEGGSVEVERLEAWRMNSIW